MVVRRRQGRKDEKEKVRHALLRATLRLAAPYGFASLSLREVAREAGIAPTSFYRHFEDMEQLGLALVEESVGPLLRSLVEPCRGKAKRPWDIPALLVEEIARGVDQDPDLWRFFLAERFGGSQAVRAAVRVRVGGLVEELCGAMQSAGGAEAESVAPALAQAVVALSLEAAGTALDGNTDRQVVLDVVRAQLGALAVGAKGRAR